MPKYDTCFFERYAQISLETILGARYAHLINEDRPDLQDISQSIGIEVTRAIREDKNVAQSLVDEIKQAGTKAQQTDEKQSGFQHYTFGLNKKYFIGSLEYDYWRLALPLQRILISKIEKVGKGFYGNFQEFGLYVFSKDDLSPDEIRTAMHYTMDLQQNQALRYQKLFISQIQELIVCDLETKEIQSFAIPFIQAHQFYERALRT